MTSPSLALRLWCGLLAGFAAGTLAWITVGLLTPGDFFANGNVAVALAPGAFAVGAAWMGYRRAKRGLAGWLLALAGVAALFWIFAPNGWWASPPPR
ncbi:MAG TPA: hypothetical protein VFQ61_26005 [Polyangiaceae bacterium]|nr:hypothetical protein [Polyangiaceae bacterium]